MKINALVSHVRRLLAARRTNLTPDDFDFEIESELARTVSSDLFCVRCPRLRPDPFVLKVQRADADAAEQRMFVDGNVLTAQRAHPNIVRILATGTFADGRHWVAMPHYARGSLATAGPLPLDDVLRIAIRVADVLDMLHTAGAVHRDVKPGNILLDDSGEPVLTDLNIAGRLRRDTESLTTERLSLDYAAPEVRERGRYSVRSEVYALGVTMIELLVEGQVDDDGRDPSDQGSAVALPELESRIVGAPTQLLSLLAAMVAHDPNHRPTTCAEVAHELRGIQGRLDLPVTLPTDRVEPGARQASDLPRFANRLVGGGIPGQRPRPGPPAAPAATSVGVHGLLGPVAVLGSLVCLLAVLHALPEALLSRFDAAPPAIIAVIGGVLLVLGALSFRRLPERIRRSRISAHTTADIAELLAVAVRRQWESEAGIRRLNDPYPLPVSWRPAPEHLFVGWRSIEIAASTGPGSRSDRSGWALTPEDLSGTNDDLVDVVTRRVPTGRLVVLGEPGAGKTMLLVRLTLGILYDRSRIDGRVPVLVSLASWNPAEHDLRSWLKNAITTDNPWLRRPAAGATTPVQTHIDALLDEHRIFPILDGLDEIPDAGRAFAIEQINVWLSSSMRNQLALSCRLGEYETLVRPSSKVAGARLTASAGVLLQDLDAVDVREYLERDTGSVEVVERWEPVLAALGGGGPVDAAFRTPLMISLARTVYNPRSGQPIPEASPAELCDASRFRGQRDVERHLFEGFVPAAYRDHPDKAKRCLWTTKQAERWLGNLARHLGDPSAGRKEGLLVMAPLGGTDLAWWELYASVSPWLVGVTAAAIPGIAVGLAADYGKSLGIGLGAGLIIGVVVAVISRRWAVRPRTTLLRRLAAGGPVSGIAVAAAAAVLGSMLGGWAGQFEGFGKGTFGGLVGAVGVGLGVGPVGGLLGGVLGGLAGGFSVGLTAGIGPGLPAGVIDGVGGGLAAAAVFVFAGRRRPARGLRRSGWSVGPAVGAGSVAGIGLGLTAGLGAGLVGAVAGFCLGLLNPDADPQEATSPRVALLRDRSTFLAFGLVSGLTVFAGASLAVAPIVGIAGGITVGLVFGSLQAAWGRFAIARFWLAARRKLPWRLLAFLADAHTERGVLRQVGAVYQFRHADLQRHLARPEDRARSA